MGDGEEKMSPFRPQKCVLCTGTDTHTHTHTQTETDRQTDRQTNRQTDRQTHTHTHLEHGEERDGEGGEMVVDVDVAAEQVGEERRVDAGDEKENRKRIAHREEGGHQRLHVDMYT